MLEKIAATVFVFGLLVFVHELGHFITAKLTGMGRVWCIFVMARRSIRSV